MEIGRDGSLAAGEPEARALTMRYAANARRRRLADPAFMDPIRGAFVKYRRTDAALFHCQ